MPRKRWNPASCVGRLGQSRGQGNPAAGEKHRAPCFIGTIAFLVSLLLAGALSAAPAPKRTCRILFLQGPDSAPKTLHLFDGTRSQEVELPRMNLSPVYQMPAGNLALTLLPAPPPADPKEIPSGAPSAKVPESIGDFYLLLTSDPSNAIAPVRMQVIDAGMDKLRAGQMLWFNLTDNQIVGGRIGTEKLVIRPQSSVTLDAPASGAKDYPVNLGYLIPGSDQLYPICETQWLHDPRSRTIVFIFTNPGSRTPRVLVFPDYRQDMNP